VLIRDQKHVASNLPELPSRDQQQLGQETRRYGVKPGSCQPLDFGVSPP
jgi:hypothetical protein